MSYSEIYNKRLNRFGDNFLDRVKGQRQSDFLAYLKDSVYQTSFILEDRKYNVVLKPNKQDETKTTKWLLSSLDDTLCAGMVIEIDGVHWMVLYSVDEESRGYNKYLMLKLTYLIKWTDKQNIDYESYGYFFGKMDRIIQDLVRSTIKEPQYSEPNNEAHIIMPVNKNLKRQDYLLINEEGYIVTGYDFNSTPGVGYYSLRNSYIRTTEDNPVSVNQDETFWLQGGE